MKLRWSAKMGFSPGQIDLPASLPHCRHLLQINESSVYRKEFTLYLFSRIQCFYFCFAVTLSPCHRIVEPAHPQMRGLRGHLETNILGTEMWGRATLLPEPVAQRAQTAQGNSPV